MPIWQVIPFLHGVSHAPHLFESDVGSEQTPLHRFIVGAQPVSQVPCIVHMGTVAGQTLRHAPQLFLSVRLVSQTSVRFEVQCAHPCAHEEAGTAQTPELHVAGPAT
jgi:hypothetical protein